jgi:hypothetical protein
LSAPAASASATCGIVAPDEPNWVTAVTAIWVAFATSICPAAARARAPFRSPPRIWVADRPAFVSSISASATWVAEYPNACPCFIAASDSRFMSAVVAWDSDCSCAIFAAVLRRGLHRDRQAGEDRAAEDGERDTGLPHRLAMPPVRLLAGLRRLLRFECRGAGGVHAADEVEDLGAEGDGDGAFSHRSPLPFPGPSRITSTM